MPNFERLRRVLDWAEDQQQTNDFTFDMDAWVEVNQPISGRTTIQPFKNGEWMCHTNGCVAGSAALMEGKQIVVDNNHDKAVNLIDDDGRVRRIEVWAAEYFELDGDDADNIFYAIGYNTIREMKQYINEYFNREVFPDVEWQPIIGYVPSATAA